MSPYPYTEHGPYGEVEWVRDIQTAYGPAEIGRHRGDWVARRKGRRTYAPAEFEELISTASIAGALLTESLGTESTVSALIGALRTAVLTINRERMSWRPGLSLYAEPLLGREDLLMIERSAGSPGPEPPPPLPEAEHA